MTEMSCVKRPKIRRNDYNKGWIEETNRKGGDKL